MQNHADRDKFVTIQWDNIIPEMKLNFKKVDPTKFSNFNTPYDYYSTMHYAKMTSSANGKPTIVTKDPAMMDVIGVKNKMSEGDITRIKNMYQCTV
jgi:hypothetical protein